MLALEFTLNFFANVLKAKSQVEQSVQHKQGILKNG